MTPGARALNKVHHRVRTWKAHLFLLSGPHTSSALELGWGQRPKKNSKSRTHPTLAYWQWTFRHEVLVIWLRQYLQQREKKNLLHHHLLKPTTCQAHQTQQAPKPCRKPEGRPVGGAPAEDQRKTLAVTTEPECRGPGGWHLPQIQHPDTIPERLRRRGQVEDRTPDFFTVSGESLTEDPEGRVGLWAFYSGGYLN